MLNEKSMEQTIHKLERFASMLKEKLFTPVVTLPCLGIYETTEALYTIPDHEKFSAPKARWGGDGVYAWMHFAYTVPETLAGKALYFYPRMKYYEGTLFVNGQVHSNFAAKFVEGSHGNHWCNRLCAAATSGQKWDFDLECYAWHDVVGTQPFTSSAGRDYLYDMGDVDLCLRDDDFFSFYFDLTTVLSLRKAVSDRPLLKACIENALYQVHMCLLYDLEITPHDDLVAAMHAAQPYLQKILDMKSGDEPGYVGLIGHSHMDTAWLWPMAETVKKCARTYANVLNLMDEYPEFRFVQSSAYHAEMLRKAYPELFARIQAQVQTGRWEPNGGVWVECDCNLTGGESMIRQFLWGQRFTQKYFGYTADAFWLPDTFGYAFAIPQIMLGCKIRYFLTTKIAWNDTNRFPMTTFYWQGMDGSRVLTHFNRTHIGPTPETLREITDGSDAIRENRTSPMRLFSFGKGDGGGGPEFEMLESARRLENLEGLPRTAYTTVSHFMRTLEESLTEPSVWANELYLELHRSTLTNQHEIKRNNRKCEIALHTLEFASVARDVHAARPADGTSIHPLMETLLVNQFHDILPGTCIHRANTEAKIAVREIIQKAGAHLRQVMQGDQTVLLNPLSFPRQDTVYLPGALSVEHTVCQTFIDLNEEEKTAIYGLELPAYAATKITLEPYIDHTKTPSPFRYDGESISTPFAQIMFSPNGGIASFVDLRAGRELVCGLPFNTFLMTEDVPAAWDAWDLDADEESKFHPVSHMLKREVVANGPVELRIRTWYQLTEKSSLVQDMVFDAHTPLVTFETKLDWQDTHRFLKTAFDTSLMADGVRNEIQFGYIRRSNHRSTPQERAQFEVCNHKYSDLSEQDFGIALLNDCKYGISVQEGSMRLSLHKGGTRPDPTGDIGLHFFTYALLPHEGGFCSERVVRPAYCLNVPPVFLEHACAFPSLVTVDHPNVVIETIKPCEDTQCAYILRLYECAGSYAKAHLSFGHPVVSLFRCNMLEEDETEMLPSDALIFTPFHIETIKICYA